MTEDVQLMTDYDRRCADNDRLRQNTTEDVQIMTEDVSQWADYDRLQQKVCRL
jgi:hypothetical protein